MQRPDDDEPEQPGGHAARRLEDFLRGRLPPGVSPEQLNPELAKKKKDESGPQGDDAPAPKDDRDQQSREKPGDLAT